MNDQKFSVEPKLELDFSSKDKLDKSLKTKKILGNVEINNIVNNIKDSDFVLSVVLKHILEKINIFEQELTNLKYQIKNNNKTVKQELTLKITQLKDIFDNCKECQNLVKEQKNELIKNIDALYKKYPGSFGSNFDFDSSFLDQQEMQNLKKKLYEVNNYLNLNYICNSHKEKSVQIKEWIQTFKSLT